MPEKYVYVDGLATFLRHTGPTTLPDRPPDTTRGELIVCLHGTGWTSGSFDPLLESLADAHSVLAFDFPGHGRSGGIDSLGSVERLAEHARGLAAKLALPPAVFVGHGLGGAVALELALEHRERVRALVLLGAAAEPCVDDALLERVRRVTEGRERRFFRRELYAPSASREVLGAGFAEDTRVDPRVLLGNLRALAEFRAVERLGELEAPTLVLVGEHEQPALRAQADALAAGIPGALRREIPDAGHQIPLEAPEALAAAVADFVAELPR